MWDHVKPLVKVRLWFSQRHHCWRLGLIVGDGEIKHGPDWLLCKKGVKLWQHPANSIFSLEHALELGHGTIDLELQTVRVLWDCVVFRQNTQRGHFGALGFEVRWWNKSHEYTTPVVSFVIWVKLECHGADQKILHERQSVLRRSHLHPMVECIVDKLQSSQT